MKTFSKFENVSNVNTFKSLESDKVRFGQKMVIVTYVTRQLIGLTNDGSKLQGIHIQGWSISFWQMMVKKR